MERYLLPASRIKDLKAGAWLRRREAGWAEALRHLEREVAAPVPGGWQRVQTALRHDVRCLATGELGALRWRQPPVPQSRRKVLWRRTIAVLRTALAAAPPLAAVLAPPPARPPGPDRARGTRTATALRP